jgi:hypothetical protein
MYKNCKHRYIWERDIFIINDMNSLVYTMHIHADFNFNFLFKIDEN